MSTWRIEIHRSVVCSLALLLLVLLIPPLSIQAAAQTPVDGWTVLEVMPPGPPTQPNLLLNSGLESGSATSADHWAPYGQGYAVDAVVAHSGSRSIRLTNASAGDERGASQVVQLNQAVAQPLYFGGWSRAANLTGQPGYAYSIYLDIQYTDNTWLWGQVVTFATGTHDWEYQESYVLPAKPIKTVYFYLLLRWEYTGSVWFDDLTLQTLPGELAVFDDVLVAAPPTPPDLSGQPLLNLSTGDGLDLSLTQAGGAVAALTLDGAPLVPTGRAYTGGFFVRDVANGSDFVHFGGAVSQAGGALQQTASLPALGLTLTATLTVQNGHLDISGDLGDTSGLDRAVTLYFALPFDASGWTWGDSLRSGRPIAGAAEFRNTTSDGWSDGPVSRTPWSAVTAPGSSAAGLSLAFPLDAPRQVRLVQGPVTRQFYLAFDLGLSSAASLNPSRASFRFLIYRHSVSAGVNGMRAAAQRYYDALPALFTRRTPPGGEGIWVAFSDLDAIPNLQDFHIVYHEGDLTQVPFDDGAGVSTLRYVSEPWSYWMAISDPNVNNTDYNQVLAYLQNQYVNGSGWEQQMAEATLSAGSFDEAGRYRYEATAAPWCNNGGNCAVFTVNPDPEVSVAPYTRNKAQMDWNSSVWGAYSTVPGLDGEYIDSFLSQAPVYNFRREHFAAAAEPLTFDPASHALAIPEVFSVYEFARWLSQDVHARGKLMMANAMFLGLPWGGDLFDFNGSEVNWYESGQFTPPSDDRLLYLRTLSYQKPYGTLMNMNFNQLTYNRVETYFQISLFYGIFPSMFSADASGNRYWDQPALYNRDRPLFIKYIPLIQAISQAGWQPLTSAQSSSASVYLERYGAGVGLYLAGRNMTAGTVAPTLTIFSAGAGLPANGAFSVRELIAGTRQRVDASGGQLTWTPTLPAAGVALFRLCPLGDVDDTCAVDVVDVQAVASFFGQTVPPAPLAYDFDQDGTVDLDDVMLAAGQWGW
ncbi:hypothetical protein [Candidatus Amarolinea dominans]|uniref:hypothetical protein n=1 Tax=Candidatus Amarolinea dominans TaxID=3140696 RepID=UPI001D59F0DB|nr:hypothetical protein [Anaerolineae bacterium]